MDVTFTKQELIFVNMVLATWLLKADLAAPDAPALIPVRSAVDKIIAVGMNEPVQSKDQRIEELTALGKEYYDLLNLFVGIKCTVELSHPAAQIDLSLRINSVQDKAERVLGVSGKEK